MKETILLFNPPAKEELLKIETALFPLGVLAGLKDMEPAEGVFEGEELPDTMFIFCFLSDSRLNQALAALRKCGAGPFPYKAILTPTNSTWTAPDCFSEIRLEHETLHKQSEA